MNFIFHNDSLRCSARRAFIFAVRCVTNCSRALKSNRPSVKHFASWLCLAPNNRITGRKIISTASKKTTNRAAQAFRLGARSLYQSHSALGASYRRLQALHRPQLAIKATAHKLARIVYAVLKYHTEYRDLGELQYDQLFKERALKRLSRKAADFGLQLVPLSSNFVI
jgi:transposase